MANRFWDHLKTLIDGQTARTTPINEHLDQIAAGFDKVAAELQQTFRFPSGTPDEAAFKFEVTAAQRANQIIGFDAQGVPQLRSGTFTWRGNWASSQLYRVNDMVRAPSSHLFSLYTVIVQHTSSDFATNLAAGFLELAVDLTEMNRFIRRWQIITTNHVAQAGDDIFVNVSGGAVQITLPATPQLSDQPITVCHVGGNIAANPITIVRNGKLIMALAEDMTVNTVNASFELSFCNDTFGWRLVKGT
jgi:hypothetical protein